ncbi:MAG: ribonuclease D [Xanthomonadales bacterium]|nr:ribonuclease D [Xanthomonadales bacterium]
MLDSDIIDTALRAATRPVLLDTQENLQAAARVWASAPVLGVDTEFLRERTYRAALGLVQVSDGISAWLVDTVTLGNLDPLKEFFTHAKCLKVVHSAAEDLEVLWNNLGAIPSPLVDTQIACALLGQSLQMSYHNMVKWLTGVEVDKEQTRSNWIRRPLKPEQLHYAATDVVFLPAIFARLQHDLDQLNRWQWLEEDVNRMVEKGCQLPDIDRAYLRIQGSSFLDRSALHVLQALAAWREKIAIEKDSARGFILQDSILMQIAIKQPGSIADLAGINEFHPKALARYAEALLEIVRDNKEKTHYIEQAVPLSKQQGTVVKLMREEVDAQALRLGLDPSVLASRKQLEALLRANLSGQAPPGQLMGWRKAAITDTLLELASSG